MGWLKGMLGGGRRPAEAEEWTPQAWETAPAPRGLAEGTLAFDAATATIASPVAASAPPPAARVREPAATPNFTPAHAPNFLCR